MQVIVLLYLPTGTAVAQSYVHLIVLPCSALLSDKIYACLIILSAVIWAETPSLSGCRQARNGNLQNMEQMEHTCPGVYLTHLI